MKKNLLTIGMGLLLTMFGTSVNASGWVCPPGGTQYTSNCEWEWTGRGHAKTGMKPVKEILKDVRAKAEKEASKLDGKALVEAASKAAIAADIAVIRADALKDRIDKTKPESSEIQYRSYYPERPKRPSNPGGVRG